MLPPELYGIIACYLPPATAYTLREASKATRKGIASKDPIQSEFSFQLFVPHERLKCTCKHVEECLDEYKQNDRCYTKCWKWACRCGHLDVIRYLMKLEELEDWDIDELMEVSSRIGNLEGVKLAVGAGGDVQVGVPSVRTIYTQFPIDGGALTRYPDDEDYLKDWKSPQIKKSGAEALGKAAGGGHIDIVNFLLDVGIEGKFDGAYEAARHGHLEVLKTILGTDPVGLDSERDDTQGQERDTAYGTRREFVVQEVLGEAAIRGYLDIAKFLLSLNAHPDGCRETCAYPLLNAAHHGHTEIIRLLLEKGANVHFFDDSALVDAISQNHLAAVTLLLEHGAKDAYGPIAGADVHAYDDEAIYYASMRGRLDTVKLLLEHGANPNACGGRAFDAAVAAGHTEVTEMLVETGGFKMLRRRGRRKPPTGCEELVSYKFCSL
ncbi:hypothetical protein HDV00_003343 [Rhizophlyctis rosea]|nr:hypothetical protein HDV00_003343 [Rhizophlyctis rosea]